MSVRRISHTLRVSTNTKSRSDTHAVLRRPLRVSKITLSLPYVRTDFDLQHSPKYEHWKGSKFQTVTQKDFYGYWFLGPPKSVLILPNSLTLKRLFDQKLYFTHLLLTTLWFQALVTFSNSRNRSAVSWTERIPPNGWIRRPPTPT